MVGRMIPKVSDLNSFEMLSWSSGPGISGSD